MARIVLLATMDTKAQEAFYLKSCLLDCGVDVTLVDIGMGAASPQGVDITQAEVAGPHAQEILSSTQRDKASALMKSAVVDTVLALYEKGALDGIISFGGSGGTTLASAAMRALPLGLPKLIVTTVACGDTLPYLQGGDIVLMNPVVDIQNLNFLSRMMLSRAASMMAAMAGGASMEAGSSRAVAISCFGVTTPCVERVRAYLEDKGWEVLIFHTRGASGGAMMEKMIREGCFEAVIDITTTEIIDEVAGGIYPVGDERLRGAVKAGIPYIVAPGALEMVNLASEDKIPSFAKDRVLYRHSPASVKMRASAAELERAAEIFAERLSPSVNGLTKVLIPLCGFDNVDKEGSVFWDPDADRAFVDRLSSLMGENVGIELIDCHINEEKFSSAVIAAFEEVMGNRIK